MHSGAFTLIIINMTNATNTDALEAAFDAAMSSKGKYIITVSLSSCMGGNRTGTFRVARRSNHKNGYWAQSLTLGPVDGGKVRKFAAVRIIRHKSGKISAALGDMAATLHSITVEA